MQRGRVAKLHPHGISLHRDKVCRVDQDHGFDGTDAELIIGIFPN